VNVERKPCAQNPRTPDPPFAIHKRGFVDGDVIHISKGNLPALSKRKGIPGKGYTLSGYGYKRVFIDNRRFWDIISTGKRDVFKIAGIELREN